MAQVAAQGLVAPQAPEEHVELFARPVRALVIALRPLQIHIVSYRWSADGTAVA